MSFPSRLTLVVALSLGAPALASAQPADETAKTHLERGLRYFDTQDYAEAIAEFKAGYQLEPNRDFLYALAQAQRLAGNCRDAAQAYQAFLRTKPPEKQAELARGNLARCEQEIAREPQPAPAPAPPAPAPAPAPAPVAPPPPAETASSPFYTDWFGDALAGLGIAGLGVGVGLWVAAAGHAGSANDAHQYGDYVAEADSATELRTAAIVAGGIGAALLCAGIVRYATRPTPSTSAKISVVPALGGARLSIVSSF